MPYPGLLPPEPLPLQQPTADPYLYRRYSNTVFSLSLWGLWVLVHTRFVWVLWVFLVGMGFDSKWDFTPPTILLGLFLCPWTWGISSKSLQCHAATAPAPTILMGLLCSWKWGIYSKLLQHHTASALLEWVDFPFSRGSSQPRDQTQVSHIAGGFFTSWATIYEPI